MRMILLCFIVSLKAPLLASDFDLAFLNAHTKTADGYHLASLAIPGEKEKIQALVGAVCPATSRTLRTELPKLGKTNYRMIEFLAKKHFSRYAKIVSNMLELTNSSSDIQTWCLTEILRNMNSYPSFDLLNQTILTIKTLMPSDPTGISRFHALNYFRVFLGKGFSLDGFQEFYEFFNARSFRAENQAIVIESLLNICPDCREGFCEFVKRIFDSIPGNDDEYSRIIFALSGVYLQAIDEQDSEIKSKIDDLSEKTFANIMTVLKPYRLKQRIES